MASILVVDDEFGIGELLEAVLEDDGHHIVTAMNGRHALERMPEAQPDLVISDFMMPVMDGAALLQAIRAEPETKDLPFVLMCALPESAIADRVTGYTAYLKKPFKIAEVSKLIDSLLKR